MSIIKLAARYAIKKILSDKELRNKTARVVKSSAVELSKMKNNGGVAKAMGKKFVKIKNKIVKDEK